MIATSAPFFKTSSIKPVENVKTAKPKQDPRFDVPAIGLTTLQSMEESGCKVLAIEANSTIFAEQEAVIKEANKKGIVILAVEQE